MDTVCGLLLEYGEFSAIDVLRVSGLLDEAEETARHGEDLPPVKATVDDSRAVRELLREVHDLAAHLGLEVQESGGESHRGVDDPDLDALLRSTWRPSAGGRQLDLFVDSARALAIQALRDALLARDAAPARRELERLVGQIGEHRAVAHAEALIAALEAPPVGSPENAVERLARLEGEWLPAASALLARQGGEFLAPLWRDVAGALEGVASDPVRPELHASRAWARCGDSGAVVRTVRATQGHASNPDLLGTLAEAYWALSEHVAAMECWFALCRLDPRAFEKRVSAPGFPDRAMQRAWREAQNSDVLEEDLAPRGCPPGCSSPSRGLPPAYRRRRRAMMRRARSTCCARCGTKEARRASRCARSCARSIRACSRPTWPRARFDTRRSSRGAIRACRRVSLSRTIPASRQVAGIFPVPYLRRRHPKPLREHRGVVLPDLSRALVAVAGRALEVDG